MKRIIDIDDNVFTRLFDNGVDTSSEDREVIDRAVRNSMPYEERPQGKWIKIFENPFTNGYVCPFCGHKIQVTEQFLTKVTECEACGADMRSEQC